GYEVANPGQRDRLGLRVGRLARRLPGSGCAGHPWSGRRLRAAGTSRHIARVVHRARSCDSLPRATPLRSRDVGGTRGASLARAGRPPAFLPCPALATDPSQNVSGISGLGYLAAADVLESLRGAAIRVEARLAA